MREAIQLYAEMESRLDQIEHDPEFVKMMELSEDDIRAGRVVSHRKVAQRSRAKKRR